MPRAQQGETGAGPNRLLALTRRLPGLAVLALLIVSALVFGLTRLTREYSEQGKGPWLEKPTSGGLGRGLVLRLRARVSL